MKVGISLQQPTCVCDLPRHPHSNLRLILAKLDAVVSAEALKTLTARFMEEDCEADAGTIHERMFRTILREFIGKADMIEFYKLLINWSIMGA